MSEFRICRKCGLNGDLELFVIDKKKKFGRANLCKDCRNKEAVSRRDNRDFKFYLEKNKNGYFLKTCPLHGGLEYKDILLVHRKTRGKYYPTLLCSICELIWRKEAYNEERRQNRLKSGEPLVCACCNTKKEISNYSVSQLKTKSNICFDCRKKKNERYHLKNSISREFYMTRPMYDEMLKSQNYVCKICKNKETATFNNKVKRLSVDHCHETKKIRGILCQTCNAGIGHFKNSIALFYEAINYLKEND